MLDKLKEAYEAGGYLIGLLSWVAGLGCMVTATWNHNHHLAALGLGLMLGAKK